MIKTAGRRYGRTIEIVGGGWRCGRYDRTTRGIEGRKIFLD